VQSSIGIYILIIITISPTKQFHFKITAENRKFI